VIDAKCIEEVCAPAGTLLQPLEALASNDVPSIERHTPVLSVAAEGVGRRAYRNVQLELVRSRPDIGAVAIDHERQVADRLHGRCLGSSRPPLSVGDPLKVVKEQDFALELAANVTDGRRLAPLQVN